MHFEIKACFLKSLFNKIYIVIDENRRCIKEQTNNFTIILSFYSYSCYAIFLNLLRLDSEEVEIT